MFVSTASNMNTFWADLIVDELIRLGADMFCIAPGSRSTPLVMAVASHPDAKKVVHYDERGTAFYALGYARATRRPAVWITTSGTAVGNGLPAVIEASMDGVPMLLLTADRPPELRQTGANQTINQVGIFGDYLHWQFDVPVPDSNIDPAMILTTIDQAFYRSVRMQGGPVHLNLMFREPLTDEPDEVDLETYTASLDGWKQSGKPFSTYVCPRPAVEMQEVQRLWGDLRDVKKGLVVAGRHETIEQATAVRRLAASLGWPLIPDIGSQLRLGQTHMSRHRIENYDLMLGCDEFVRAFSPEAVLHLGSAGTSKRLSEFLAWSRPLHYIVVRERPDRLDPNHQVTQFVESDVISFCSQLEQAVKRNPLQDPITADWLTSWGTISKAVSGILDEYFSSRDEVSEPKLARLVSKCIREGQGLFLSSSMPIREMDRFGLAGYGNVQVGSNRGASGIDGMLATAAGYAAGLKRPVTLVVGDLAMLHDLNSLALIKQARYPVIVVVINNDGGGIFSFLPIAKNEEVFESYFGTPHGLSFEKGVGMFGIPYSRTSSADRFVDMYKHACSQDSSAFIEVATDRSDTYHLHEHIHQLVGRKLQEMI